MEGKGVSGGVAEVREKFLTVYMVSENSGLGLLPQENSEVSDQTTLGGTV